MILSARCSAPDIQAQWLKTSGITVRHLLWLLLALTHVAFAIDPNEPPAELNRTCGSNPDRAPDGSGTFAQSAGADLWLGSPSAYIALIANISNPPTGAIRQGKPGPLLKDRNGRWDHTAPGSVCTMARRQQARAAGKGCKPVFSNWCGLLWISFFNQCSINNLRARKIELIVRALFVH